MPVPNIELSSDYDAARCERVNRCERACYRLPERETGTGRDSQALRCFKEIDPSFIFIRS